MHVILQIPIFDFRAATSFAQAKLTNPSWPLPLLNRKPFMRQFGTVRPRINGGVEDWIGEEYFCEANHALKYVALQNQRFKTGNRSLLLRNIYKRLFSDGKFLNKIELGLRNADFYPDTTAESPIELKLLFKHYLQLPVRVGTKQMPLLKAGPALADLFFKATSRHSEAKNELAAALVRDGEPCLFAIVKNDEHYAIPREAKLIDTYTLDNSDATIQLYGYTIYLDGYYIKSWIIRIPRQGFLPRTPANAILRKLRINLMRIHAEKEIIKGLLNAVQQKHLDIDTPAVNIPLLAEYLQETGKKLFKEKHAGIDRQNMLDFALRSEQVVMPGDTLAQLVAKINDKFLARTMQKFVDRSIPVDKKVVLFMCSSPMDKNLLNFGEELKVVQRLHESSIDRANFQIEIRTGMERIEVPEQLVKLKPDILHISLHANNVKGLYFQDAARNADPMAIKEWISIIQLQQRIHKPSVIILSACNSFDFAKAAKPFADFAVGTIMVYPDEAGVEYARGFYTILFNDENTAYDTCHLAGVNAISNRKPPFAPIDGTAVDAIICQC
jgi:hypothetical protein